MDITHASLDWNERRDVPTVDEILRNTAVRLPKVAS